MADLVGQTLGQYTLESVIGKGGMAYVYSAVQKPLNRLVAVKVMKSDIVEDAEFAERFEREVQLLVDLEHPHIVPVIDYGNRDGQVYIVMRRIDGGSLHQRLRVMGVLPLPIISKILQHVGSALTFAHQKGIVHRDMKPSNVMLDTADNAYLTDFGIAKLLASTTKLTASNTVLGTPVYMAPEQWRGEDLDARTDIYALGIMTYEMVTGKPPYEGDTSFTLMYKHFNEMPPLPTQVVNDLPPSLEAVILRAIAKSQDDRFQSAEAFAEAFRAASEGKAVALPEIVAPKPTPSGVSAEEDETPTIAAEHNKTAPYPTATETRNLSSIVLVAILGAIFIIVGISIGIILPMLNNEGDGHEAAEQEVAARIALLTLEAAQLQTQQSTPPPPQNNNTGPQPNNNNNNNQGQGGGAQTVNLPNGVKLLIPNHWAVDENASPPKAGDDVGNTIIAIRGDRRDVAEQLELNPLQALRDPLDKVLNDIAIRNDFENGFTTEQVTDFAIPAFRLKGIAPVNDNRMYVDYFIFELEGPPDRRDSKEWLILISQHVLDANGYSQYENLALSGLLMGLEVDGRRLIEINP